MVINGFSILELRKLFIDEFYQFYQEVFYNLEAMGTIKKGSYNKLIGMTKKHDVKETVKSLKEQIFKGMSIKKKK